MAKVTITDSTLRVSLSWFESLQALRLSFEVPLRSIRGATEDSNYVISGELGLRSPGTGFPGLIAKGTFRKPDEKVFALWRKGQETVVVELQGAKFSRLVLGCTDARLLAGQINESIPK